MWGAPQSLASLHTVTEEESSPAQPAQPLPSSQTFTFQTQIRRCVPSPPAGLMLPLPPSPASVPLLLRCTSSLLF